MDGISGLCYERSDPNLDPCGLFCDREIAVIGAPNGDRERELGTAGRRVGRRRVSVQPSRERICRLLLAHRDAWRERGVVEETDATTSCLGQVDCTALAGRLAEGSGMRNHPRGIRDRRQGETGATPSGPSPKRPHRPRRLTARDIGASPRRLLVHAELVEVVVGGDLLEGVRLVAAAKLRSTPSSEGDQNDPAAAWIPVPTRLHAVRQWRPEFSARPRSATAPTTRPRSATDRFRRHRIPPRRLDRRANSPYHLFSSERYTNMESAFR